MLEFPLSALVLSEKEMFPGKVSLTCIYLGETLDTKHPREKGRAEELLESERRDLIGLRTESLGGILGVD